MKAMVLAAGLGMRLRPLTDRTPKALVEAGGKPLLAWQLERLARVGVRDVVINVSHLGAQIEERFRDGADYGLAIRWSREPEPLETAGGIAHARSLLGPAPFLLVNADIWCDYDLAALRARSIDGRLAHLVLVPNPPHHAGGDFALHDGSVSNDGTPRYTYAGIAVMSPVLVKEVAAGQKAPLGPLLRDAAARGALTGEVHRGIWSDVGTAERLAELRTLLNARQPKE